MRIILIFILLSGCTLYDSRNHRKYLCKRQLSKTRNMDKKSIYRWCDIEPYDRSCPCYGITL